MVTKEQEAIITEFIADVYVPVYEPVDASCFAGGYKFTALHEIEDVVAYFCKLMGYENCIKAQPYNKKTRQQRAVRSVFAKMLGTDALRVVIKAQFAESFSAQILYNKTTVKYFSCIPIDPDMERITDVYVRKRKLKALIA